MAYLPEKGFSSFSRAKTQKFARLVRPICLEKQGGFMEVKEMKAIMSYNLQLLMQEEQNRI